MLILSSATINNSKTVTVINNKAHQIFLTPATPVILGDALTGDKPTVAEEGTSGTNETVVVDTTKKSGQIFTEVEQVPEFPGGLNAFGRFLGTNVRYPKADREKGIQGRVIATFVVETDGSLSGLKISRGISKGLDEESLRVLRKSPNWKPGIQNGRKVRVQYSVPISFTLADDKSGKPVPDKTKEKATADENTSQGTGVIYTSVEKVPEFPGGLNALGRFLGTNIRYPSAAREKHIQGRVILTFVVEADGSLSSFKILRGVSPDIDAEALRVMAISPKWEPGIENSEKVRVQYSIPISFTLADDKSGKPASNKTGAIKSDNNANTYANVKRSKDENDSVLIRRSLTGPKLSNEPLYVLDGKEITAGDMKMINPNTIQSINVLKDRSAATIYGDKGANGVIVITSKGKKKAVEPTKYN
jgi:TonB family protein